MPSYALLTHDCMQACNTLRITDPVLIVQYQLYKTQIID